ncbi:uncharacterized protein BX663DRAFT_514652 [Cokeromyces recurvatus]|uniref:uncharacterized protein n=1 Tax=Cokeromyces recurvatus TaxID=90255 RepID=UPI00221EA77D|nr:uncharacterized protein BX663DRAFT_514652 [Cokeromyces recurvatus]KAI7901509.1 hypothetical protein BX663DRAFT_514652 [Cokeromyces recurvatus]
MSMDKSVSSNKIIGRKRNDCNNNNWKRLKNESEIMEYPAGPIEIYPSWNPLNRTEKPPYSYATIIGHAILTSKDRKLTLHDIYIWITKHYPFYSNESQGWQNSIRHNLSLHKAFVKIERDTSIQNPPRKGCFWTIRKGKEQFFIDNLQRPLNNMKRQSTTTTLTKRQRRYSPMISSRTTTTKSNCIPESELTTVLSSSSDHLSSSSSSGSPTTYRQLLLYNIPETSISYNVYPEQTTQQQELYGEDIKSIDDSNQSYLTESSSSTITPSSSYRSQDLLSPSSSYHNIIYPSPTLYYNNKSSSRYPNFMNHNVIDWNYDILQQQQQLSNMNYDNTVNFISKPNSYLLQLSSRNHHSNSFHR